MNDSKRYGEGTFIDTLLDAVRQNPVPGLLIGAGCLLLVADGVHSRRHVAPRRSRQIARQARSLLNEQPLVCAAAGAALGAVVAALLPPSKTEDQLLGPTGGAVKQKLADLIAAEYQSAKAEAGRAAQELTWVAAREALACAAAASSSAADVRDKTPRPT
jgi:hypothetical protein